MVGLDVCEKMPFSFDRYQAFLAGQRPEMKKLLESTYAGQQFAKDKAFIQYVWDVLAAAILIDPSLIAEERTCAVDVNAEFGPSYGQALALSLIHIYPLEALLLLADAFILRDVADDADHAGKRAVLIDGLAL